MEVTEVVQFFFAVFVEVDEEVKKKKTCPMIEKESNKWILDLLNYSVCLQLTRKVHEWEEGIELLLPASHSLQMNTEKVERKTHFCHLKTIIFVVLIYSIKKCDIIIQ